MGYVRTACPLRQAFNEELIYDIWCPFQSMFSHRHISLKSTCSPTSRPTQDKRVALTLPNKSRVTRYWLLNDSFTYSGGARI